MDCGPNSVRQHAGHRPGSARRCAPWSPRRRGRATWRYRQRHTSKVSAVPQEWRASCSRIVAHRLPRPLVPHLGERVRRVWLPRLIHRHVAAVGVLRAQRQPLLRVARRGALEDGNQALVERQRATRRQRLRLVLDNVARARLNPVPRDGDSASVEVNVGPPQPGDLATTQAAQRQIPQVPVTVLVGRTQHATISSGV